MLQHVIQVAALAMQQEAAAALTRAKGKGKLLEIQEEPPEPPAVEIDDLTCAICLEQMKLADTAIIKGCEHSYCGEPLQARQFLACRLSSGPSWHDMAFQSCTLNEGAKRPQAFQRGLFQTHCCRKYITTFRQVSRISSMACMTLQGWAASMAFMRTWDHGLQRNMALGAAVMCHLGAFAGSLHHFVCCDRANIQTCNGKFSG